jgi:small-conductance mechanosensitive channel
MTERIAELAAGLPPWGVTLLAATVAALLALLAVRIGAALVRRAVAGTPSAAAVAAAIHAPARLLLPLIALSVVWHGTDVPLPGLAAVQRLTAMAAIGALTWLLVRAVGAYGDAVLAAHPMTGTDNLEARRVNTQTRVLTRTVSGVLTLAGVALVLMTIPAVRQVGASLLASAGVIGLVAGFAARPVLGNLIAGLQIGLTQPIRIDDVVIVEGEWGVIEEIGGAFVVVRIWDDRRLVVPLQYWVEKPFQNWTRRTAQLTGTVTLWVDYRLRLAPLRAALQRACEASADWDGRLALLQVTDAGEHAMQLRALVTAANASRTWDLRCHVREALIDFVQREHPDCLPHLRVERPAASDRSDPSDPARAPAAV